jgi:hypothetical protein
MCKLLRLSSLFLFLWAGLASAFEPASDPALASVRIKSHGASGTIIATQKGKSWILGCAHMHLDSFGRPSEESRKKELRIDGPNQPYADNKKAKARLLAWDHELDLSLIEIDNGPFYYVPVAKQGHKPGAKIRSVGYDDMKWPVTNAVATLLSQGPRWTYAVEKPWHGRSGGGLIDVEGRVLVGVVHGYEVKKDGRGIYVSHEAVLQFLAKHGKSAPVQPPSPPPLPQFQELSRPRLQLLPGPHGALTQPRSPYC